MSVTGVMQDIPVNSHIPVQNAGFISYIGKQPEYQLGKP